MKPNHRLILPVLVVLVFVLQGCQTPEAPASTPAPLPPKTPPPLRVWDGATIQTICLITDLDFPEDKNVHPIQADDAVQTMLTRLGLKVVVDGSNCDVTLRLKLKGEGLTAYYNLTPCVTGATIDGTLAVEAAGKTVVVLSLKNTREPSQTIDQSRLHTGKCGDGYISFWRLWGNPLVFRLAEIWGPQAYVFGMDYTATNPFTYNESQITKAEIGEPQPYVFGKDDLEKFPFYFVEIEISEEVILALIYALEDENPELREAAAYRFAHMAPAGEAAIPYLIQRLDDTDHDVRDGAATALGSFGPKAQSALPQLTKIWQQSNREHWKDEQRKPFVNALEQITGKDYR